MSQKRILAFFSTTLAIAKVESLPEQHQDLLHNSGKAICLSAPYKVQLEAVCVKEWSEAKSGIMGTDHFSDGLQNLQKTTILAVYTSPTQILWTWANWLSF